ncbi:MAG: serpin family protein [Deltaproteobacteria bacterium]|nr:serpin family protein [Deltaproteobacteria bacterium]
MKRMIAILALLLSGLATTAFAPKPAENGRGINLVPGHSALALELYRELAAQKGNLFFSPYSVSSALAMTYAGARGATEQEMARVLHFASGQEALHPAFRDLNRELVAAADNGGQKLEIANALVLTGGDVSDDFKKLVKQYYEAEIFGGKLEQINAWVRRRTHGKIDSILERLSPNTVCAILNAVYFKGIWQRRFRKENTAEAPFRVSEQERLNVPLMFQKNEFQLLEKEDFQAISIPYRGNGLDLVVLLPRTTTGLGALEQQLSGAALSEWLRELDRQRPRKVRLFLPRFRLETGYDLVPPFQKLGMKEAFTVGVADFRGMGYPKGDLFINQIRHKAFVEVNEEGTEAAAATAVEMALKAAMPEPLFRADHPFLFLIRDRTSGALVFLGRLEDPRPQ